MQEYYLKNKDKIQAKQKLYREQNKEKCKELQKEWYIKNIDKLKPKWSKANQSNPEKIQAYKNAYKRRLKNQKAIWANDNKILEVYLQAQKLGLEVDHIIPLKGEYVSGLHVENNLQLLTKQENCQKSNYF